MQWGLEQWGVPSSGSVVPGAYSDSPTYGPNPQDVTPVDIPTPDPQARYIREYLVSMPFEVHQDTQSLLSFVISVLESEHYAVGGPIK